MTKLYCDTSNLSDIKYCIKKYNIDGVTTNPSIMRKEGVKNYKDQCNKILRLTNCIGSPHKKNCNSWKLLINDLCKQASIKNKIIIFSVKRCYIIRTCNI